MSTSTVVDLWNQLDRKFGLDHWRGGRDNTLYVRLQQRLGCPTGTSIGTYLNANSHITPVKFVRELIQVGQPFSLMYRDVYRIMRKYNAKHTNESQKIRCDLGKEVLDFDMDHFLEFEKHLEKLRYTVQERVWNSYQLYQLTDFFGGLAGGNLEVERFNIHNHMLTPPTQTGSRRVDAYVREIYQLLTDIREDAMDNENLLKAYTSACWYYESFVTQGHPLNEEDLYLSFYEKLLSETEKRSVTLEDLFEQVEAFLNLPFWKNRWYLYEVWITLITVEQLDDYEVQLNVVDGVLPLRSGSHKKVAQFVDRKGTTYTLHAQLQTPVTRVAGRKGIEPDLRLVEGESVEPERTVIIVECKQRKAMTEATVNQNVGLYEHGAVNSVRNLFVNYDQFPVDEMLTSPRTHLLSNVVPGGTSEYMAAFQGALQLAGIEPQRVSYDAVLLDVTCSMEDELADERIPVLQAYLKSLRVKEMFYFDRYIIDTDFQDPVAFLQNFNYQLGHTSLVDALHDLRQRYPHYKKLLVLTDGDYSRVGLDELKQHMSVTEVRPSDIDLDTQEK